jgi:hypothetical protein
VNGSLGSYWDKLAASICSPLLPQIIDVCAEATSGGDLGMVLEREILPPAESRDFGMMLEA